MRFRLLLLCFILVPIFSFGQFEKSSHIVGGTFAFGHTIHSNSNSTGFTLDIGYAYGFGKGIYFGSDINLRWNRNSFNNPGSATFTPAPFIKYYFTNSDFGGFYANAQFEFTTDREDNIVTAQPSVGYSLFAGEKVFFEFDLSYNKVLVDNSNDNIRFSVGFFGLFGGRTNY